MARPAPVQRCYRVHARHCRTGGVDGTPADDSVPARLPCVYLDDVPHALAEHVVAMAARMLTGGTDVGQPLVGSLGLEGGVTETSGASSAEGMQQLAPTLRFGTEVRSMCMHATLATLSTARHCTWVQG